MQTKQMAVLPVSQGDIIDVVTISLVYSDNRHYDFERIARNHYMLEELKKASSLMEVRKIILKYTGYVRAKEMLIFTGHLTHSEQLDIPTEEWAIVMDKEAAIQYVENTPLVPEVVYA